MSFVAASANISTADELLGEAQRLIDSETDALSQRDDIELSCAAQCSACCNHAVVVTAAETRQIKGAVAQLPVVIQERISRRTSAIQQRLVAEGLVNDSGDSEVTAAVAGRYHALDEPCPLLIEGQCSVRSVRPLVCRDYLVSSPVERCFEPGLEQVVRIRRTRQVDVGFLRVSEEFGENTRTFLLDALERPTPEPVSSSQSGARMAKLLLTASVRPR